MKIRNKFWLFVFLLWAFSALSQNSVTEKKVSAIADQLRCPICRGVPVSESPSELAINMTKLIRQKLEEGKSEAEILRYFVDRYGEWILLKPIPSGMNLSLWILPALLLVGGGSLIAWSVFRWTKKTREVP